MTADEFKKEARRLARVEAKKLFGIKPSLSLIICRKDGYCYEAILRDESMPTVHYEVLYLGGKTKQFFPTVIHSTHPKTESEWRILYEKI